jgi:hypothetical protein
MAHPDDNAKSQLTEPVRSSEAVHGQSGNKPTINKPHQLDNNALR